jgi:RHS repeat-associated protein
VGTYKYDAQGRRLRKAVTNNGGLNGTTRFIWGGDSDWQCLEERDGNDALVARFTYSPGYIDAVAVQERDLNADSDFGDTNEVVYYHQNALFSVYALSDGNGSVIEKYRFDAYGGCTVLDADGSVDADGLSDVKNPYTFTGRRLDSESGLMQYRNRCYSATLGRFTSREPQGYGEGLNLFAYVGGGPTVRLDPTGERTWTVEVGNPGLPHFFEMAPGVPAVITGTIWEVYGNKGQVIFRQGRAGAQKAPARCQGRTVTIKFYYRVASLKVDEVVKAQVDRILQQCVNRCVAKCPDGSNKHKVELAWEETAMSWEDWADSDERGKHGGNFFGFNATEWNLYFEERQGRKIMLGQTPSLWFPREFVVFRRGIENRVTVQGHKVSNVLATTIAHEGFNHCIAGNWGHPGGMGQEYIDSAEGNTTGQAVLSDPACKELCDEMDIN